MAIHTIATEYPTTPFSRKHLRSLVEAGNKQQCIDYINTYLFKTFDGFIFFDVVNYKTHIQNLNNDKINNYLPRKMRIFDNKGKVSFDVQEWFINENDDLFKIVFAPGKPVIYTECENNFINLFVKPKHNLKPYNEFSDEIKEKVNVVLNHIYDVLCDKNDELYNYMLNWFSNVCMFKRNSTGLYFKSGKGTGKSIFIDSFINKMVLQHLALATSDTNIITGYNQELSNKTLLVLEEAPTGSKGQWHGFNDTIKAMITNTTLTVKQRYKDELYIDNFINFIVVSNHNSLAFTTDQRRFVLAQISDKRVGDFEYFNKLASVVKNKDVATAFFVLMRERYVSENVKKFQFNLLPKTDADKDLHIENLPKHLQFIKDEYIATGNAFNESVSHTYDKYCKYHKGDRPMTKIIFNKDLKKLGLKVVQKTINSKSIKMWNASHNDIVNIFEEKGWLHEDDDIDAGRDNTHIVEREMKFYQARNIELEERVAELEAQLFELQNKNTD